MTDHTSGPARPDPSTRLASETAAGGSVVALDLAVNGVTHHVDVEARRTLSDVIRDDIGLTGTHLGCEHGVCGACTVLIDGEPARSCLMFAAQAEGAAITTIEGVAMADGTLHPVQQALHETHGFQCGFCSPGFVLTAVAILNDGDELSDEQLREELSGNLCRCTGYDSIVAGVRLAVRRARGDEEASQ